LKNKKPILSNESFDFLWWTDRGSALSAAHRLSIEKISRAVDIFSSILAPITKTLLFKNPQFLRTGDFTNQMVRKE
jgi:hypothetical protein